MKKLTAMLLVLVMMLSLCACGEKNVSGTVSPQEEQTEGDFQLAVTTGVMRNWAMRSPWETV